MTRLFGLLRKRDESQERTAPVCRNCVSFNNDPHFLEAAMPGLRAMSSATGSVRSDDGLCARHDRYLGARASCPAFQAR